MSFKTPQLSRNWAVCLKVCSGWQEIEHKMCISGPSWWWCSDDSHHEGPVIRKSFHIITSPPYIMMTSSNGNIFRVIGHLCGEFTGHRWIPRTKPVTRSFDVFFDLCLHKKLSKQSWGWWFETLSHPLWRHRNIGCVFWQQVPTSTESCALLRQWQLFSIRQNTKK